MYARRQVRTRTGRGEGDGQAVEEKRPSTIDFKAFVFFFVYVYTFFLTVIFINKGELMKWENSLFADQEKTHLSLAYFNNFPNDYYILGGRLY